MPWVKAIQGPIGRTAGHGVHDSRWASAFSDQVDLGADQVSALRLQVVQSQDLQDFARLCRGLRQDPQLHPQGITLQVEVLDGGAHIDRVTAAVALQQGLALLQQLLHRLPRRLVARCRYANGVADAIDLRFRFLRIQEAGIRR